MLKIGFDLDGVISYYNPDEYKKCLTFKAIEDYYFYQELKHNPYHFLHKEDEGYIITSRSPDFKKITMNWLIGYKIHLPVYIVGQSGNWQDWSDDNQLRHIQAKAQKINHLGIDVFFEDNRILELRQLCPNTKIIGVK